MTAKRSCMEVGRQSLRHVIAMRRRRTPPLDGYFGQSAGLALEQKLVQRHQGEPLTFMHESARDQHRAAFRCVAVGGSTPVGAKQRLPICVDIGTPSAGTAQG